jgi:hypothetical protein
MSLEWFSLLGAAVSGFAMVITLHRLFLRSRSEKALVSMLVKDNIWQDLISKYTLHTDEISDEQAKILKEHLRHCIEMLAQAERAPLYEGLTQDSTKGQAAYLAKLVEESALQEVHAR